MLAIMQAWNCTRVVETPISHWRWHLCAVHLQSAGLATTVALTSSAVFCVHCLLQQDQAASLHPPLMYACILALLLLPWDVAFKVRSISFYFGFWCSAHPNKIVSMQRECVCACSKWEGDLLLVWAWLHLFPWQILELSPSCRRQECSSPLPSSEWRRHTERCRGQTFFWLISSRPWQSLCLTVRGPCVTCYQDLSCCQVALIRWTAQQVETTSLPMLSWTQSMTAVHAADVWE